MPDDNILIHVGQAGAQIGDACWELLCLEHGISPDGTIPADAAFGGQKEEGFRRFFFEHPAGKHVPRVIFVDLDDAIVNELRNGRHKSLYLPEQLVTGKEDAANNFCRGYYNLGRHVLDPVIDKVRTLADNCDHLAGFQVFSSCGGGTGAGLGSLLLERLSNEYGMKSKVLYQVWTSPSMSTSTVEPYNAVLGMPYTLENADACILLDNEQLYDVCRRYLDVELPRYENINRVIAQVISSITAPMRFEGPLKVNLADLSRNLVPTPRLCFALPSYAPFVSPERAFKEPLTVADITAGAFDPTSVIVRVDPRHGKYLACLMLYRGDVAPKEVNAALAAVRSNRTIQFADWSPTGFKVGINYQPPTTVPGTEIGKSMRSLCMLSNNTAIVEVMSKINHKFDLLFSRRAFVHHFVGEGMDAGEFNEARESCAALERDYDGEKIEQEEEED
jgi:tubulin alpha